MLDISLGEREKMEVPEFVDVEYIDPKDQPFAKYTFLYRSLGMLSRLCGTDKLIIIGDLRRMHIILRTPSPVPGNDNGVEQLRL